MADNETTSSDAAAQRAAEQARLRKERREAKIKAGGSSRLNKITGIGGRVIGEHGDAPPATETSTAAPAVATTAPSTEHDDPGEVDISEHFYKPETTRRVPQPLPADTMGDPSISEVQLRQMMLGMDPSASGTPTAQGAGDEDPMMKMMSQMMAAAGGGPNATGAGPDASPFAGMMQPQTPAGPDLYTTFWRLLHALVALGLGFYIVLLTPFAGSKAERDTTALYVQNGGDFTAEHAEMERNRRNFFWAFATAEAVLLTTRFFLDKGRAPPAGMLWTIVGHIPEPWKGYISAVLRYGQIFTTVRTDILICTFVLGVSSWWRG